MGVLWVVSTRATKAEAAGWSLMLELGRVVTGLQREGNAVAGSLVGWLEMMVCGRRWKGRLCCGGDERSGSLGSARRARRGSKERREWGSNARVVCGLGWLEKIVVVLGCVDVVGRCA